MTFSTRPTSNLLIPFIRTIWSYAEEPKHRYEVLLPRVNGQLLINLHGSELSHLCETGSEYSSVGPVAMQGVLSKRYVIDAEQKKAICGVEFEPGGLSAFTTWKATQFCDTIVDARDVWGRSTLHLRRQLIAAADAQTQCDIMESFLMDRLIPRSVEDNLLEQWLTGLQNGSRISDMQAQLGLSQRKLHALFDRRIGVRPKLFEQITRLSSSLSELQEQSSLASLAYDNGYSDQSHYTREFRRFVGTSPSDHKPVGGEPNHGEWRADKTFKTSGDQGN